jgi:hypothetical protein
VHVVGRVASDLEQPAAERPVAAELRQAFERVREDLARHVLARVGVGDPEPDVAEHSLEVRVVEREEGVGVVTSRLDERAVAIDERRFAGHVLEGPHHHAHRDATPRRALQE